MTRTTGDTPTEVIRKMTLATGHFGTERFWRWEAVPTNRPTFPYATLVDIQDGVPELVGDGHDFEEWRLQYQVDIWLENKRTDPAIRRDVIAALKSGLIEVNGANGRTRVTSIVRVPHQEGETAHRDTLTIAVYVPVGSI